jgi:uracil-DNA glycosylase family 4
MLSEGRYVAGEGPCPADVMFIGEGPGFDEDRIGRPFVGKTGRELNRYIERTLGMNRSEVYVTNLIKRRIPNDGDPTEELIRDYTFTLNREIRAVHPKFIGALGRFAVRFLLGDVDMEVVHGIPVSHNGGYTVCPIFHPAAGLHSTEVQAKIAYDFEQMSMCMKGKISPGMPVDEHPDPIYALIEENRKAGPPTEDMVAVDTEGSIENPWGWSLSGAPGTACVVAPPTESHKFLNRVILHNSMYDLGVLRAMGIELADDQFEDTMVMAYLLCVEPQGLKPLARRHAGMEMHSYEEIISAASYKHAMDWLFGAYEWLSSQSTSESPESSPTAGKKKVAIPAKGGKRSAKTSRETRRR